jgi:hypothetical protein
MSSGPSVRGLAFNGVVLMHLHLQVRDISTHTPAPLDDAGGHHQFGSRIPLPCCNRL